MIIAQKVPRKICEFYIKYVPNQILDYNNDGSEMSNTVLNGLKKLHDYSSPNFAKLKFYGKILLIGHICSNCLKL